MHETFICLFMQLIFWAHWIVCSRTIRKKVEWVIEFWPDSKNMLFSRPNENTQRTKVNMNGGFFWGRTLQSVNGHDLSDIFKLFQHSMAWHISIQLISACWISLGEEEYSLKNLVYHNVRYYYWKNVCGFRSKLIKKMRKNLSKIWGKILHRTFVWKGRFSNILNSPSM